MTANHVNVLFCPRDSHAYDYNVRTGKWFE